VVNGRVVRDAVNPGRELVLGAVATERVVDLDEDLLREVERRVVVADHAVDVGHDGALIAAHQLFEAVLATREGAHDQLGISRRGDCRGNSVCVHDAKVLRAGRG
jgi:hypothetical protein